MAPEKLNNYTGEKWRTIPNVKFTAAKSFFFFYKNNLFINGVGELLWK